jgi:hypothetical protein
MMCECASWLECRVPFGELVDVLLLCEEDQEGAHHTVRLHQWGHKTQAARRGVSSRIPYLFLDPISISMSYE